MIQSKLFVGVSDKLKVESIGTSIQLIIVDDHPITRTGLLTILSRHTDIDVIAEAATGGEACDLIKTHRPNVVLLDLGLPDMSGVDVIKATKPFSAATHFIVLSVFDGSQDIHSSLRAGATGYLLKDCKPSELLSAIRTVFLGGRHIQPTLAPALAENVSINPLSDRELEIINSMVMGRSNKEIAMELHIAETTVKSHITNIFEKMHVLSRSEAVFYALSHGIVHLKRR